MQQPTVTLDMPYQQRRSRLTVFFRYPLAILPLLWLSIVLFLAGCGVVIAWFALLITGRYPRALYELSSWAVRYNARVVAYFYLATDRFPGASPDPPEDHPVALHVGDRLPAYSRLKVLLRGFLLIPPLLIAYAMRIVALVGAVLAWFVIVATGRLPYGLYGILRLGLSYELRVLPYVMLLTEDWPPFTQDADVDALRGPDGGGAAITPAAWSPSSPGVAPELPGGFDPPAPGGQ